MTPDERVVLSRRTVLAGLGAVGAAGTFGGAVTGAFGRDHETVAARLAAGRVDLRLDWTAYDDEGRETATGSSDGGVPISFEGLAPGEAGYVDLTAVLPDERCEAGAGTAPNNPAYLWLGATCPSPPTVLAEELFVTLRYVLPSGRSGRALFEGSLRELASLLAGGLALTAGYNPGVDPADALPLVACEPLGLRLEWRLSPAYFGSEAAGLDLLAVARQARHASNASPFVAGEPCPGPECDCCVAVGKVEFEDELAEPGSYRFGDSSTDWASEGLPEYRLVVSDTVEKSEEGDQSTVGLSVCIEGVEGVPDPLLCAVEVKGGAVGSVTYTTEEGTLPGGNCSGRIYAPAKVEDPSAPRDYYGVSYVRVSVCRPRGADGECYEDLVRSASRGPPRGPGGPPEEPVESDPDAGEEPGDGDDQPGPPANAAGGNR